MCVSSYSANISHDTKHITTLFVVVFFFFLQFSLSEEDVACNVRSSYEELTKAGCFHEIAPENDAHQTSQVCLYDFCAAIIIFSSYM